MATINEKMTGLANAIRSKTGVSSALSIDGMTAAVEGITTGGSGGADVSGVTATPDDVLASAKFVDKTGTLKSGTIQTVTLTRNGNTVSVQKGYVAENASVTIESSSGGSSDIKFGYWTANDEFQEIDLSGDTPANVGDPVSATVSTFKTGQAVPDYAPEGDMQFYVCTGYEGVVEKIIVTAGAIYDDIGEPCSLIGEYTIVDPQAAGTERKWYCPATTASGDYRSMPITIGCVEFETGWDDETGDILYEKYWSFCYGTSVSEYNAYISSQTIAEGSPFGQVWSGMQGSIDVAPVLTSETADVAPYGPTGWSGRPIVMTDKPVFFTYGAGVESANGFWEQIAGDGLTKQSEWQLVGGDSILKNRNNPESEYGSWGIVGNFPDGTRGDLYSAAGDSWLEEYIKHPSQFSWQGSSYTNPPPTFIYSETVGYFPAENVVSGLTYTGKPPKIGGFYNADATIKAERFYPA